MKKAYPLQNNFSERLDVPFFQRDVLEVAPDLLGKSLVTQKNGNLFYYPINEVEAYRGEEDKACHASKGRTKRTEILYLPGGYIYVYLIYGMYWMFNIVTGKPEMPQAVLIRGIEGFNGPGKLTKFLKIDRSYNGENICSSNHIWIEDTENRVEIKSSPRIGIDYAGDPWAKKLWRFQTA
jgi:DNA-3-methyladenine glycosylase